MTRLLVRLLFVLGGFAGLAGCATWRGETAMVQVEATILKLGPEDLTGVMIFDGPKEPRRAAFLSIRSPQAYAGKTVQVVVRENLEPDEELQPGRVIRCLVDPANITAGFPFAAQMLRRVEVIGVGPKETGK